MDERLQVLGVLPFGNLPETHVSQLISILSTLPNLPGGKASVQAPILVVPRIFEPELCQVLIAYYNHHLGKDSGFMREVQGRTVGIVDHNFKRRRDQIFGPRRQIHAIEDESLRRAAMFRIHDRLAPEIKKAFQFDATRIERHIVACYDSTIGGFFNSFLCLLVLKG